MSKETAIRNHSRVQWLNDRVNERRKALGLVNEIMGQVYDTEDQEQLEKAAEALARSAFITCRERDRIVGEMMWDMK